MMCFEYLKKMGGGAMKSTGGVQDSPLAMRQAVEAQHIKRQNAVSYKRT